MFIQFKEISTIESNDIEFLIFTVLITIIFLIIAFFHSTYTSYPSIRNKLTLWRVKVEDKETKDLAENERANNFFESFGINSVKYSNNASSYSSATSSSMINDFKYSNLNNNNNKIENNKDDVVVDIEMIPKSSVEK
jgi:uncharacterized membrane protein